jgi:hypothetical protein
MTVAIEAVAYSDVDAMSDFYDQQESGVGLYFVQQFACKARSLETTGGIHVQRHGFHFCLIERFPVALYYQVENNEVRIVAVLDCRRSPRWIRRQLKDR